jgi:hypothetical protein
MPLTVIFMYKVMKLYVESCCEGGGSSWWAQINKALRSCTAIQHLGFGASIKREEKKFREDGVVKGSKRRCSPILEPYLGLTLIHAKVVTNPLATSCRRTAVVFEKGLQLFELSGGNARSFTLFSYSGAFGGSGRRHSGVSARDTSNGPTRALGTGFPFAGIGISCLRQGG